MLILARRAQSPRRIAFVFTVLLAPQPLLAQVPAGPTEEVDTTFAVNRGRSAVDLDDRGNAVYVWHADDGSGDGEIFARRYAAGTPVGAPFAVNTYTTGLQAFPKVALDSHGGFVIVWGGDVVAGRRFDASGNAIGGEFQVNQSPVGYFPGPSGRGKPTLSMAPSGNFVVAWKAVTGVLGRRFDARAAPLSPEFVVATTDFPLDPSVAVTDDDGRFVVVYDKSNRAIFGRAFAATGEEVGAEFQVHTTPPDPMLGTLTQPSIAAGPSGTFVVVWTATLAFMGDVVGQRFDQANQRIGSEFVVAGDPAQSEVTDGHSIATDENGNFVVAWSVEPFGGPFQAPVFARRFDASTAPRGGEFQVSTTDIGNTYGSHHIASDRAGNFVVAWHYHVHLYGRRYGGIVPEALAVDTAPSGSSDGNGVLEPAETVSIAPSWRNINGVDQAIGGAARFDGPAGPVYALVDAAADYGVVPNGAVQRCTVTNNCYSVFVDAPAMRPAAHWDAVLREDLQPDAHGQTKNWLIHVGESFPDVPRPDPFYRYVETVLHAGVTSGCSATAYCPDSETTREQMAVFLLVAKEGTGYQAPPCGTPMFADVPAASPFCPFVEELARRGVTGGCGGGLYCPTAAVAREQMAALVLRTLDPALVPPACVPGAEAFADVPASSGFCRWIEELARRGVVTGCGGGRYCPAPAVARDQMSVFLTVTFGLTLYGP